MTRSAELRTENDTRLADLIDRLAERIRHGETVSLDACVGEYPEFADQLRQLLPALELMADLSVVRGDSSVSALGSLAGGAANAAALSGTLGDFRILREIGRGGMGVVYEAEQISLHRRVALKMLPFAGVLDTNQLQRFQNEAVAAASLKHPNIVAVYSVGCERGIHYYAMEYVEGQTLAETIRKLRDGTSSDGGRQAAASGDEPTVSLLPGVDTPSPPRSSVAPDGLDPPHAAPAFPKNRRPKTQAPSPLPDTQPPPHARLSTEKTPRAPGHFQTVAAWGIQAAEALEHAHQMGVVHRDIKPSNLLIDAKGRLLVTDFGLAQTQFGPNLTMTGDILGTLRYMSPEQAQGNRQILDHRSDIYSLGVTLYELLTLRPPFASDDRHVLLHEIVDGTPPPLRQHDRTIPRDLETIVLKAISSEPQARYATAQQLADDLTRFLQHKPIRARRPTLADRAGKWVRRHKAITYGAAVVVLLAAIAAGTLAQNGYRRAVQLESDVAQHIAAAEALLESGDYAGVSRELSGARARLEVAGYDAGPLVDEADRLAAELAAKQEAIERFEQFQSLRHRIHSEMHAVDRDILEQAQEHCRTALDLYHAMDRSVWRSEPAFTNLSLPRQKTLEEGVVELLFVWARLEVGKTDTLPPAERTAGHRRAIDALARIQSLGPPIPAINLWLADSWDVAGEKQAAAEARSRANAVQPAVAMDYFILGEHHAQNGRHEQALSSYWQALAQQPDHYLALLASGIALGDLKKYESAETMLTGTIAMNPQAVVAYAKRGISRLEQGKILLAQADFKQAAKLDPQLARALARRADNYRVNMDLDKALADCNEAIRLDPKSAFAHAQRGGLYGGYLRDWDKAIPDINEAIRLDPRNAWPYIIRAQFHEERGDTDKALADCNEAIRVDPAYPGGYWRRGCVYLTRGQLDMALADMNEALRIAPRFGGAVGSRGAVYLARGEREKALADFSRAIELEPKNVWVFRHRADLYRDGGDFSRALRDYDEAIRISPRFAFLYHGRALVHVAKGDLDKALADYGEAIRLDPKNPRLYSDRAGFYTDRGDFDKALADYSEAVRLNPKDPSACLSRGDTYRRMGQIEKALADCETAGVLLEKPAADSKANPDVSASLNSHLSLLGNALQEAGRIKDAENAYRRALAISEKLTSSFPEKEYYWYQYVDSYGRLIRLLRSTDRLAEAKRLIEGMKPPRAAGVYTHRAKMLREAGEVERAFADYGKTVELDPKDVYARFVRAEWFANKGQRAKAVAEMNEAVRQNPNDFNAYRRRGDLFRQIKEFDKAIADYDVAYRMNPNNSAAIHNRGCLFLDKGELDRAIADFNVAVRLANGWRDYSNRGTAYSRKGEWEKAKADFEKAIQVDPRNPSVWAIRGNAHARRGLWNEAIADFEKAAQFDPSNPESCNNVAWHMVTCPDRRAWKPARAVELAKKATQLAPKDGMYWNTLGVAQYRAGDHNGAIASLTKGMELRAGGDGFDWFFLAMAHWQLKNPAEARKWFDKAVAWMEKNKPKDEEILRFRAEAEELLGIAKKETKPPAGKDKAEKVK